MITKLDFVGIPSQDAERSRTFLCAPNGLSTIRRIDSRTLSSTRSNASTRHGGWAPANSRMRSRNSSSVTFSRPQSV